MSRPYSRDSIAHALSHHESRGALLTVSQPEPGGRKTWRVTLPDYGEPVELTEPQAWALCLGLRASEIVALQSHERFVHELAAYAAPDNDPPCLTAGICDRCALGNHTSSNGTAGCYGGDCDCPCNRADVAL